MKLANCQPGDLIRCPAPGCGADAIIGPSWRYLTQQRPCYGWLIVSCSRCGRTQWPMGTVIEPRQPNPLVQEAAAVTVADMLAPKTGGSKHGR